MNPSRKDASIAAPARELAEAGSVPSPVTLAARIREHAASLGFDAVGFARAGEHPHADRLRAWLTMGRHGGMRWMARDPARRTDPRAVLPEARTVISVALAYYRGDWPEEESAAEAALRGRIARYAWGRDYHRRVKSRLTRLARALAEERPGARWLAYADTGPMLDRGWAERAGIGWIGKNTNVIRKSSGSWCFLGEILTDAEIESSAPAKNYCGRCSRCIEACPTGAIVGPYELDARRCISYLTIEHKGAIPLELRPAIGSRIFGCDDCQEVCPWNRFAVKTANPDFAERPEQQTPELIPLLSLDGEAFRRRYLGTAILRAGRAGFARNVAVALGNVGDARAMEPLRHAVLADPDETVRTHAAWALGRIADRALREQFTHEVEGDEFTNEPSSP